MLTNLFTMAGNGTLDFPNGENAVYGWKDWWNNCGLATFTNHPRSLALVIFPEWGSDEHYAAAELWVLQAEHYPDPSAERGECLNRYNAHKAAARYIDSKPDTMPCEL